MTTEERKQFLLTIRGEFENAEDWIDPNPNEVPEDEIEDLSDGEIDTLFWQVYEKVKKPRRPVGII